MKNLTRIIILLPLFLFNTCYEECDYLLSNLNVSEILILVADTKKIEADGASSVELRAEIPVNAKEEKSVVNFFTNVGKFREEESGVTNIKSKFIVDRYGKDKKIAIANLVSSQEIGKATVTASIGDIADIKDIEFLKAYPESIKLSTDKIAIKYGFENKVNLTTRLSRSVGNVSSGTFAETIVVDSNGTQRGYFTDYQNLADDSGKVVNGFTLGDDSCKCNKLFAISRTITKIQTIKDTILLVIQNE